MSLKSRLSSRQRPSTTYRLRIDDDETAQAELDAARAAGDESRILAARQAVEACYEQVRIVALPPGPGPNPRPGQEMDMETLLQSHQPTDQQRARDKSMLFNPDTFVPALLAACIESDVSEEDWREYTSTGAMTKGEVIHLFDAVWSLNYRAPDPDLPKG